MNECKTFMKDVEIASKMDKCLCKLIVAMLDRKDAESEDEFVLEVVDALKELFPAVGTKIKPKRGNENSIEYEMDAVIFVGTEAFPFVVIEAKNNSYSMNAVLQGLQYYEIIQMYYIDNDPCFLMTIDKGIGTGWLESTTVLFVVAYSVLNSQATPLTSTTLEEPCISLLVLLRSSTRKQVIDLD